MSQSTPPSPFLGGGPRFNQAGNNKPLPGEKSVETPPPPPFGGPRVWTGIVVVLALLLLLFFIYGQGLAGVQSTGNHQGISPGDKPSDNSDSGQ
jgi:hypothetical protein